MEIIWSPSALARLDEIAHFISSVERLLDFPLSGSLVLENPAFRQLVVQGYRIIYRVKESSVEIVAIVSPRLNAY